MDAINADALKATKFQGVEVARIINRYFRQFGVRWARELPEEAQIRLSRDLADYFEGRKYVGCSVYEWWIEIVDKCRVYLDIQRKRLTDWRFKRRFAYRRGTR